MVSNLIIITPARMTEFLKKEINSGGFELLIDSTLFKPDIVLKAAYNFLDRGYFFFKLDGDQNIILQFSPKEGIKDSPEKIIRDYSDELLNVALRHKLEKENKIIREAIIRAAISNSVDAKGFISIDTARINNVEKNSTIDFNKDIDEILREIENDPDLKIDEAEIERILKEIEEETQSEVREQKITINPNKVQDAKKKFQSRK